MPRSDQLINVLKDVIEADANLPDSVIKYFLTHDLKGGWEGWLQVVFARAVIREYGQPVGQASMEVEDDDPVNQVEREKPYPFVQGLGNQQCDLWFHARKGTGIWVELKTQREAGNNNTIGRFTEDIDKLRNRGEAFRTNNVLLATAVLAVSPAHVTALIGLLPQVTGRLKYWILEGTVWYDVTQNLSQLTTQQITQLRTSGLLLVTWHW